MSKSANELCALLITKQVEGLTIEEEDLVVDYLYKIGIDVSPNDSQQVICNTLISKLLEKEGTARIPRTAFANKLIENERQFKIDQANRMRKQRIYDHRLKQVDSLVSAARRTECLLDTTGLIPPEKIYTLIKKNDFGLFEGLNGSKYIKAVIKIPSNLYKKIFQHIDIPILKITPIGKDSMIEYIKIEGYHNDDTDFIYMTESTRILLNIDEIGAAKLQLCKSVSVIDQIDFIFYGNNEQLIKYVEAIKILLPNLINAYSVLKVGITLTLFDKNNILLVVLIHKLYSNGKEVFIGALPPGTNEIPMNILADIDDDGEIKQL